MVLENKLGLTTQVMLAKIEERISKSRAKELYDSGKINDLEVGTFKGLADIHAYLFSDIYPFAGKIRSVNLAKGMIRFVSVLYLQSALTHIDPMPQSTYKEIIEKYVEMNMAHPFRDGNGRSMRIWLDLLLKKELKLVVNWELVEKEAYLSAMERSSVNDLELRSLLATALTDHITDRDLYMKGIDVSYFYEGYTEYTVNDLLTEGENKNE